MDTISKYMLPPTPSKRIEHHNNTYFMKARPVVSYRLSTPEKRI